MGGEDEGWTCVGKVTHEQIIIVYEKTVQWKSSHVINTMKNTDQKNVHFTNLTFIFLTMMGLSRTQSSTKLNGPF